MVGEFEGPDGDYAMVVNLSLEKSANILLHTQDLLGQGSHLACGWFSGPD